MDARNKAAKNRAIRQDALREYLSARGKVDYIFDNIEKIEKGEGDLQALKIASELRLKLVNKYLPDMKHIEADIDATIDAVTRIERVVVDP